MPRALIIGAGVAGPAAAMFLTRAGWDVEVFEAESEPDPFEGLFLNVATNGSAVLAQLGLRDRLVADGHRAPPHGHAQRHRAGARHRAQRPGRRPRAGECHRAPGLAAPGDARGRDRRRGPDHLRRASRVHRGGAFAGARDVRRRPCRGGRHPDRRRRHRLARLARWIDPAAPEPRYSGPRGHRRVRARSGPGADPRHAALRLRRALLLRLPGPRRRHRVLVREHDGSAAGAGVAPRRSASAEWLARLRDLHSDDPFPVPQILANVSGQIGAYPIFDLVGVQKWSRGRVVAIGDAVHATSPSAGQGASLALEDAITLARCLRDLPDRAEAFAAYQRERQPARRSGRQIRARDRLSEAGDQVDAWASPSGTG